MKLNSLAFRLFATAAVWTLLVLPVAGLIIYSLFRQEAEANFDDRLRTLLLVVLSESIDEGSAEPATPSNAGEPLFEITHSGWYWQIAPAEGVTGRTLVSASLATGQLESPVKAGVGADPQGFRWINGRGPLNQPIRIAETLYTLGDGDTGPRYTFRVAGPLEWLEARVSGFRTRLATALALAGLGLLAVTVFQVRFGLLPLQAIERGLAAIRSGERQKLEGELPLEIEPLQQELNALIQSNQDIIERARTQVGNLAHALKTPLAVITNEASELRSVQGAKIAEQASVMRDQVNLYLDRARMAARAGTIGRVTEVRPVIEGLQRALERINRDRRITVEVSCPAEARFQGERQDLEEMLGNLMDNACKWARATVTVTVATNAADTRSGARRLSIVVEDDGRGLTAEQRSRIGKRGLRLDETKPGSGLGLSIVADLAQSYRGRLDLDGSRKGGLAARLDLPAV